MNYRNDIYSRFVSVLVFLAVGILPVFSKAGSRTVTSLPNLAVRSFAQDGSGFMWIATDNGLCRYSGHDYLYFFNEPNTEGTLPSDKVKALAVDGNDVLWVLTDKGLCNYDRLQNSFREVSLPFAVDGLLV
ncbi:MAG: two-component regulator propeller domain-containing protein, partial [Candidatus Cryptobacteroides sp.]